MTPPSRHRPLTALLLTLPLATAATDPDCGSPTYSGFALKLGTACRSYVYCQSGEAASETACPEGLLFNGGAGRGDLHVARGRGVSRRRGGRVGGDGDGC